jgi:hypothetical protein
MVDQNQLENLEYLKYFCSLITNYARCKREFKARISMAKAAFKKLTRRMDLDLRKKLVKFYIWIMVFFMVLQIGHFGKYSRNILKV